MTAGQATSADGPSGLPPVPGADSSSLLWSAARPHRVLVGLSLVLGFAGALLNGIGVTLLVPLFLGFLGQEISLPGGSRFVQHLLGAFAGAAGQTRSAVLFAVVLACLVLKNATGFGSTYAAGRLRREITCDLRERAIRLVLAVDVDFYTRVKVAELIQRINWETLQTASAVLIVLRMVVAGAALAVFLALMLLLSWKLTLVSLLLLAVVISANHWFIRHARRMGGYLSERSSDYAHALLETLSGIRLVQAAGTADEEALRINALSRKREEIELRSFAAYVAVGPVSEVSTLLALCATVALGKLFFAQEVGVLSTLLFTYLVLLFRALPVAKEVSDLRTQLAALASARSRTAAFLSREDKPFLRSGSRTRQRLQREIQFRHVEFTYPGASAPVLRDFDLTIPRGQTVALVGVSGSGKTTVGLLLARLYDPSGGQIALDGLNLRELELRGLRRSIAVVSQETFLFNTTIRHNLAYGRPAATDAAVREAARRAHALEFIDRLPEGMETRIGDRGVLLSGGQRQRLAIARALLGEPDILILDEATSALDSASERLVQAALDEARQGRTTLVIAHRLSTLEGVDQIGVLDQGRIAELGTHEELLRLQGRYAKLWSLQGVAGGATPNGVREELRSPD